MPLYKYGVCFVEQPTFMHCKSLQWLFGGFFFIFFFHLMTVDYVWIFVSESRLQPNSRTNVADLTSKLVRNSNNVNMIP